MVRLFETVGIELAKTDYGLVLYNLDANIIVKC